MVDVAFDSHSLWLCVGLLVDKMAVLCCLTLRVYCTSIEYIANHDPRGD